MLPPEKGWYTVLDLKDAFFSLSLAPSSQGYFAFEWHDPDIRVSGQLTWMKLPQGFKNFPTIFDKALYEDLWSRRSFCLCVTFIGQIKKLPWPFDRTAA